MIKLRGREFALFLGCTVPTRCLNYELASRRVANELGFAFVDLMSFGCCGFPIRAVSHDTLLTMAAYNLSIAEEKGMDIITLCSACGATLTKANKILTESVMEREKINVLLEPTGRKYNGTVRVKHFARFLYEDVGVNKIKEHVVTPLNGIRVAAHYGCHYLKPSEIFDNFDDPKMPQSLDRLIEATGAESLHYIERKFCCGGGIVGINEETSMKMSKRKLEFIKRSGAEALVLICPFCDIMYEEYQATVEKKYDVNLGIPIIFLSQLLGIAFGFSPKELGFKFNTLKPSGILDRAKGGEEGVEI